MMDSPVHTQACANTLSLNPNIPALCMLLLPPILLSVKKQRHMTQKITISALFLYDKPVQMSCLFDPF